jgi:glycosyltransferase involved in cell wall biosynthesis
VRPEYSVVIPTHNRLDILPEVLAALDRQEEAPEFEVIVVDDGSTDGTAEALGRWEREERTRPSRVLRQANQGPARARNAGVAVARGERVAFLGDDTVPTPGWLAGHERARQERPPGEELAVLGYTRWHPRTGSSPFLDYINEYGLQFGYSIIPDRNQVPFNFFYTSNLSLSRALLLAEPFDTGFPYPAWEDIEASYRLFRRGLRLVYEPDAVALHHHPTSFRRFFSRQEKAGYSAVVFFDRHPELGPFLGLAPSGPPELPAALPQALREIVARALQFFPVRTARLWETTLRYHYIRGLRRGWRDRSTGQAAEVGTIDPPGVPKGVGQ